MRPESWLSSREKAEVCRNDELTLQGSWQLVMAGEMAVPYCPVRKSSPSRPVDSPRYLVRLVHRRRLHLRLAQMQERRVLNLALTMF